MLSEQEKSEIRASYRNAIDPRQQVKILMELYLASREEIEEALGFTHKEARRPIRRHTDAGRPNTRQASNRGQAAYRGTCAERDDLRGSRRHA